MGGFSVWHWLIVGILVLLLFGKGRFSDMMGDVAKGIKSFKKGMTEDEEEAAATRAAEQKRLRDASTLEVPVDRSRDLDSSAGPGAERREP